MLTSMKAIDKKHTTIRLTQEELKELKMFCLENDTSIQAFLYNAMQHCMNKKILPKDK